MKMGKQGLAVLSLALVFMMVLTPIALAETEVSVIFKEDFSGTDVDFDDTWESDNEDLYSVVGISDYLSIAPYNDTVDFDDIQDNAIMTQEQFNYDEFTISFDVAYENDDTNYSGIFTIVDNNEEVVFMLIWNGETLYFLYDLDGTEDIVDTEVDFDDAGDFKNINIWYNRIDEELTLIITDGSKVEYDEDFDNVGEIGDDYIFVFANAFAYDGSTDFVEDTGRFYVDDFVMSELVVVETNKYADFITEYWYLFIVGSIALAIAGWLIADTETDIESILWGTSIATFTYGVLAWLTPTLFDYNYMSLTLGFGLWFIANAFVGHYLMHDWKNEKLEKIFVSFFKIIAIVLLLAIGYLYYIHFM